MAAPADIAPVQTTATAADLPPERGARVRLATLVNLRWLAVLGQTATLVGASLTLSLSLELGLCFVVVGLLALANLSATVRHPSGHRLTEREALAFVLIDLGQLTALLYLTGGLDNPFALLFMAPVTVSATVLSLRSTALVGVLALVAITLLAGYHLPLVLEDGTELALPRLFLIGFWAAIVVGTLFLGGLAWRLTLETNRMSAALLATQAALAREQKLHDLGGVVAAAAHELGTPLATIKLTAGELRDEVAEALPDRPDLSEDVALIASQADRCRDIMRSMGQAGKDDLMMRSAPLEAVLREAAAPHADRGVAIAFEAFTLGAAAEAASDAVPPDIHRSPEVIHGLRNLIQNAVDHARTRVLVEMAWSDRVVRVRVLDDGPGYPIEMMGRLGDPFLRRPRPKDGMGLGLFIAKTLLARTGATVRFRNATRRRQGRAMGAVAEVTWPRTAIVAGRGALGENMRVM
ncbi:ActS/PrrB/RegB family redox-sensitive histidine kinase [Jannaschia sp. Os4]|uniref:sensor histidine kinase RegB n=1 Tax=Jannaschia sp. Os4 TaxID=2807617 RepID=UPI00193A17E6|nr:ActS/PrrB/RegB family redox-sensitive histidine kinase [Jannaschia sp. Os4]MBM2575832.1 ActS/PrrB/RegB family redox-sensitive histidine kinase [Jannaschia sp. Os4]